MTLSYKIHTATTGDVTGQPLGYSFNFPSLSANDITVTVGGSTKTITSDYTVENWTADAGNNPYIKFTSSTARGTGTIRISRGTTSSSPTHDFQVGSAIKAADLNSCNKQNIYLAQENRDALNALALGDASSAIQIASSNISDFTIQARDLATDAVETDKIKDLNVTTDKINNLAVTEGKIADNNVTANKLKSSSSTDSDRAVTTNHIRDGAVTDAKLSTVSGSKVTPNFGSQNISTTGTLNAGTTTTGTTTTGSTTSQDLTITNNLTLSSGNANNKGLIFPTDIGGGSGDKAYIRYYVDGGGENTRLHIGNENDGDDDIYLQGGLVHTSGNFTVNGTCTANSFSGNGANLTNLVTAARQFGEATSNGESSKSSSSYSSKVTLNLNNLSSNSRVFVYYNFDYKVTGGSNNKQCYVQVTGPSFLGGNREFVTTSPSYSTNHGLLFCDGSGTSRSYVIQYRKGNGSTAYIMNARLYALEVKP